MAVSKWLTIVTLHQLCQSDHIAILADQSTDIRTSNELSVCFHYVLHGEVVERFLSLQQLQSTTAEAYQTP